VPRGRTADDRLAELERRLDALEAEEARLPEHRRYTHEEIVEIALGMLAYIYEGDTERYAREYLVKDNGVPIEKAEEMAGFLGHILEERRAVAPNPQYPV
jgi:hypothetical protein